MLVFQQKTTVKSVSMRKENAILVEAFPALHYVQDDRGFHGLQKTDDFFIFS